MIISAARGPVLPRNPVFMLKPGVISVLMRPDDSDWLGLEEFVGGFWWILDAKSAAAWPSIVITATQMLL